jgi:hypothetical protein
MAVSIDKIMTALYNHLIVAGDFATSLGGVLGTGVRLWYGQAKPSETLPYGIVQLVDGDDFDSFSNDGISLRVQVTVYGSDESGPSAVAGIIDDLLVRLNGVRFSATDTDMMTSELDILRGPFPDDKTWRMDADFLIRGRES